MFVIAQAGEEQLGQWPKEDVVHQIASAVAIAIQRGNAMTYFSGHSRATLAGLKRAQQQQRVQEEKEEDGAEEEAEDAAKSGVERAGRTARVLHSRR